MVNEKQKKELLAIARSMFPEETARIQRKRKWDRDRRRNFTPEQKALMRAKNRKRWKIIKADPVLHAECIKYHKEYESNLPEDKKEKRREQNRVWCKRPESKIKRSKTAKKIWKRIKADPVRKARHYAKQKIYRQTPEWKIKAQERYRKRMDTIMADPVLYQKHLKKVLDYYKKNRTKIKARALKHYHANK